MRTLQSLLRVLYAPLFLAGFVGLAIWVIDDRQWTPLWLLPLLLAAIASSFVAEAWLPYQRDWNRDHGDRRRDIAHALINEALNVAALASIPLLATVMPQSAVWPSVWPFWAEVLLAVVVADLGITLAHWLSHRWRPLWRLHEVHHSVRRMYGFNGLMKHPLHQGVEALGGVLPLLLAGMPLEVACVLAFAISIQLLLQHGNVDMRPGVLNRLFAWAPVHRYHHLRYGRAGDVNFGLFFTIWDRLLGTAFDGRGYRVSSDDLGIGARPDYPDAWLGQIVEPFRSRGEQTSPQLPEALRR